MNKYEIALQEVASSRGYTVTGAYINNKTKIDIICPKGHMFSVTPHNFKKGQGCSVCFNQRSVEAKSSFYKTALLRNYDVCGEYENTNHKLQMRCPNGHILHIAPSSFKAGVGCSVCSKRCPLESEKSFRKLAALRGYKIQGVYVNSSVKIPMTCPEGHEVNIAPYNFKKGRGCVFCSKQNPLVAEKALRSEASSRGYTIKESYRGAHTKIQMLCPQNHLLSIRPGDFKRGVGCSACASYRYDNNKTGYLYALQGGGFVKIGISNVPKQRISTLRRKTPFKFSILDIYTGKGDDVRNVELCCRSNYPSAGFKGFCGATEWLKIEDFTFMDTVIELYRLKQLMD